MITRTTRINNLNEKPSLILWGRVRFKSYVFVLKFTSLSYFLCREGVPGICHLVVFLFHQCITFLQKVQVT